MNTEIPVETMFEVMIAKFGQATLAKTRKVLWRNPKRFLSDNGLSFREPNGILDVAEEFSEKPKIRKKR